MDDSNNGSSIKQITNEEMSQTSILSTNSSENTSKNLQSDKNDNQYNQNSNYDKMKIIPINSHIKKMKENKSQEKDEEIKGEEESNNSIIFIKFSREIELIAQLKKNFYRALYEKHIFCDFREDKKNPWKIGFIKDILEDNTFKIQDVKNNKIHLMKIEEISKIAYFRKYSQISDENIFEERDCKKEIRNKLECIENFVKENNFINIKRDVFNIYYFIHSKIYLGLDSAMKINNYGDNEGPEESFRIILNILLFISQYYKYLLDNKEDFIKYENNKASIINSDLIDLKVVNKKIAFFSFFSESIMLLNKIFANEEKYLDWYIYFEKKLQKFVPSVEDIDVRPSPNTEYYPIYEDQINKYENKNKLLLKRICMEKGYNLNVTFGNKIKATFLAYFIDYFHALNGFKYLFELCYCDKSINIKLLLKLINGLNNGKSMTASYKDLFYKEKQQLIRFVYIFIEQLNEKTIVNYDKNDIIALIQKTSRLVAIDKDEEAKLIENMYFNYISKNLLLSKKLEQKITSLNILNDILNNIDFNTNYKNKKYKEVYSDIDIKKMNFEDFCINCKNNQILKILLNETNVHEEIIKRLPNIIFIMYSNDFGYINKTDALKIKSDKEMIFNVIFNKLFESEKNEQNFNAINEIICDFSEILTEEDKYLFFQEITKYFENNIEKKGMPTKEQLLFLIQFSIRAIKSRDIELKKENKNKDNKMENKNEKDTEDEEEEEDGEIIDNNDENDDDSNNDEILLTKDDEKLFNFKIEDKDYYFLNLLKKYLLEEEYQKYNMTNEQKIELINISSEGIIKIIENCNNKNKILLLKDIFFKAIAALEKSEGVVQFLNLIDKMRKNNNICSKINLILEEYSKDYGLLNSLINDTTKYLNLISSKNKDKINEEISTTEEKKIYEGLFENKLNIELRLKLILFLLENETDEKFLMNFKKLVILCQNNSYAFNCLNKLIYLNLKYFEPIFIIFLYDSFLKDKILYDVNDLHYYKFIKEIIKEINIMNNIFYFMNNNDIAILNCETESKIKGIDILWKFLIETKNDIIRNDLTDFLTDIFYGIKLEKIEQNINFWNNFVKSIYDKIDEIIKQKNETENNGNDNENAIQSIVILIKKIEKKINYKGEIIEDISKILEEIKMHRININNSNKKTKKKEKKIIKEYTFIGNSGKNNELVNYDIKIDSSEFFYMLRYKLSNFFKIPVNTVKVFVDVEKYDKKMQERLKVFELDLFNDFNNTYLMFNNIEKIIANNKKENKIDCKINNNIALIFKVKSIENDKLEYIKKILINIPELTKLLKSKNSEYILDLWSLIKDETQLNNNTNLINNIKSIFTKEDSEKINNIFNFENTNIYYISYILSNFIQIINELNEKDKSFISKIFLKNKIWTEKIKNIKFDSNIRLLIEEIYEKNNVIKYLLNIYKIIAKNSDEQNIFILNKIVEFYYLMFKDSINVDLKKLPFADSIKVKLIEDLYVENSKIIEKIIIENKNIYEIFMKAVSNRKNNIIKDNIEFLFYDGLLKNKSTLFIQNLQHFFINILDIKNVISTSSIEEFYLYLLNLFLSEESFHKLIKHIKEISIVTKNDNNSDTDINENNIEIYFNIIIKIIEKTYLKINGKFNFKIYVSKIILPKIFNPIIEDIPLDLSYHEMVLGGLCQVLVCLLSNSQNYREILDLEKKEEKKLKEYLFKEILLNKCNKNTYNENNLENYKFIPLNTSYCFKQAVNLFVFLLVQKTESNEKTNEINYYLEHLTELHRENFWLNYDGSLSDWKLNFNEKKKLTPFVGLKNLGCTCYMNSLLQVFYNLIPFRESLLKCECKEEKKNSLYQIKKLFYCLKYLRVNYYIPEELTKNYDNEILNVHQQMDVDEFYINILDKIENRLKKTKNENLVKYFFQGRLNDVLNFQKGCTHHRTNTNNFYSIQLQVQNKKNLYESLDALTEGELMDGDNCIFCPHCDKKVPVMKSQNFQKLPRILIFVLKRFEFNYDTMIKVKINDFYEFPYELDMTKYVIQNNKDKKNNIYTLKSIVVHMGTCENGHYYSFIKNENEKWYEFNDTQIRPFDSSFLNEETFGGEEVLYINGKQKVQKKDRNAYLLFYEKKDQSDCEHFDNIEAINYFLKKQQTKADINSNNNKFIKINNENEVFDNIVEINDIPNEIYNNGINGINGSGMKNILENINNETFKYFLSKKLFTNEYQYFILQLYLNILNYYYSNELCIFLMHLCRNLTKRTTEIFREVHSFESNLNLYLKNKKLVLFKRKTNNNQKLSSIYKNSDHILNIFKHFIIYFYNIFLRTKEKQYIGCIVDLFKFLLNDQPNCANYLIEEFCNQKTIVEYLINCPSYEIKKLNVGILYCAMSKSLKEVEYTKIKETKNINENNENKDSQIKYKISKEDEKLARKLQEEDGKDYKDYIYSLENNNPLEYQNIPKNLLKMIYNMLYLVKATKYKKWNEHRFLYFTIYRFSLLSEKTREFLIYKCRLFELLCLLLHRNYQTLEYSLEEIILSTFRGPYTVSHNILKIQYKERDKGIDIDNDNNQDTISILTDKAGIYRNENYIYMLYFYLLSYTPSKEISKKDNKYDSGYSLENKEFINALLNNIRTKQDAFCFSNYINEKSKDNKSKVKNVYEVLGNFLLKIDNNDKINYDINNYKNYVNNNMNENQSNDDPGINPKYLIIILKKFILYHKYKDDFVKRGLKLIFEVFSINQMYYSYSIMLIDLIIELFLNELKNFSYEFKKELENLKSWLEKWPIPPSKYNIEGISMYKNMKINYENNKLTNEKINEFNDIELNNTQKKIDLLYDILGGDIKENKENTYEKYLDLSDFKFIIGDVILYQNKERVIEEALDEELKILVEVNKNEKCNKKELWIEIDEPSIEIKRLKENTNI